MRRAFPIFVLLILIIGSGAAYEYRMPVSIKADINPSVLMPGDDAIVAIELQNGVASPGTGGTAGTAGPSAGGPSNDIQSSTPLNETLLTGSNEIRVLTHDYRDLGMIGPGDKVTLFYKIKAEKNVSSGTQLLDFRVVSGYDTATIKRQIPVKIDSASVSIARADASAKNAINLNVANPRENTLNAVTIIPSATGIRFSPDQYYIGTMDPDEVFTISFATDFEIPSKSVKDPVNMSFTSVFKNGDTWHRSGAFITSFVPAEDDSKQSSYLLPAGIAVLILLAAGFYMYRRKKIAGKTMQNSLKSA